MTSKVEPSKSLKNVIALYRAYTKCNWDEEQCDHFDELITHEEPDDHQNDELRDSSDKEGPQVFRKDVGWDLIQYGPIHVLGSDQEIEDRIQHKAQRKEQKLERLAILQEKKLKSHVGLPIEIIGPTSSCNESKKSMICEVISKICPPREWSNRGLVYRQYASCAIPTRREVLDLKDKIESVIRSNAAITEDGMCFQRRELITKIFDELIRQVTVACTERGRLLINIRDEIYQQFNAYRALYNSIIANSMSKILTVRKSITHLQDNIENITTEIAELERIRSEFEPTYEYFSDKFGTSVAADEEAFGDECEKLTRIKEKLKELLLKSVSDLNPLTGEKESG